MTMALSSAGKVCTQTDDHGSVFNQSNGPKLAKNAKFWRNKSDTIQTVINEHVGNNTISSIFWQHIKTQFPKAFRNLADHKVCIASVLSTSTMMTFQPSPWHKWQCKNWKKKEVVMDFLTQSKVHLSWQLTHAWTTQLLPPTGRVLPKGRHTSFNTDTKQYLCVSFPQPPPSRSSETPARPGAPRTPRSPAASGSSPPPSPLPFGESTDTSWPALPRSPGTGTGRGCGGCKGEWAATLLSWAHPWGVGWRREGCAGHRQAERSPRAWRWKGWGLSRPGPPSSCTSTGSAWN